MSTAIVDSAGVNVWPGDTVSTPSGAGTVIALLEDAIGNQLVVVTIAGVQQTLNSTAITVTARAAELAATADQSQNGEVA